jgi:hypothetical protein
MHLTTANLPYFLINGGLLSRDEIIESDFAILDASRRNRNFKVIRKSGCGLFIKQMRESHPDAMYTLRREAACYEHARDDSTLGRLMPRLITYDSARHLLIIELLPEAESLTEYLARERAFPAGIGGMLGEALGLYHSHFTSAAGNETLGLLFPRHLAASRPLANSVGSARQFLRSLSKIRNFKPCSMRLALNGASTA